MATLALRGISKSFGATKVLNDISLEIQDKEFVVFVGPSGCGKTTLLRILAGLEDASAGHLEIDGRDVTHEHPVQRGVAMVFQSYALYPHLTVFENIAFPLRVAKAKEEEVKLAVEEAAEVLRLTDRLGFKPGQLSGGQRQRVAIGRSIVRKPKVFLFDEPLSNLDAALRGDMRVELSTLHQRLDATMVYVTHDQIEAMTMADRIVVLSAGVIEQYGSPMELYHLPRTKFVAEFIGHPKINFLPATCASANAEGLTADIRGIGKTLLPVEAGGAKAGQDIEVGIRPEDVSVTDMGEGVLELRVNVLEHLGGNSLVYGNVDGKYRFCAVLPGDHKVREGETIRLGINPGACQVSNEAGMMHRRMRVPELT